MQLARHVGKGRLAALVRDQNATRVRRMGMLALDMQILRSHGKLL